MMMELRFETIAVYSESSKSTTFLKGEFKHSLKKGIVKFWKKKIKNFLIKSNTTNSETSSVIIYVVN